MRWRVLRPRRRVRRHDPTHIGDLPPMNGTLDDAYEVEAYPWLIGQGDPPPQAP